MENFKKAVSNPNWKVLVIYGIISLIAITAYIWRMSFSWSALIPASSYYIFLLVILAIFFFISIRKDQKHNSQLKRYLIISILQLIIVWSIADPIKNWQIESSYKKSEKIIEAIDKYKEKNGSYPESLTQLSETSIPKWTNLGTKFNYIYNDEQTYIISFISYGGCSAHFNSNHRVWFVTD